MHLDKCDSSCFKGKSWRWIYNDGIQVVNYLQIAVADPLITFQRRPACKVTGPEIMSVICIGEEIICLQSPGGKEIKTCHYV